MSNQPSRYNAAGTLDSRLYFSDYFDVPTETLESYGALDICVVSDLPLFIDPFLLFNSEDETYRALHDQIVIYLQFLKRKAAENPNPSLVRSLYQFSEVKQNWLGFVRFGNEGHGLGKDFAEALSSSLTTVLSNFGEEGVTKGQHLEKLTLIRPGVGRDCISDFATNLIKHYLLDYTQEFAKAYIDPKLCDDFRVTRVAFNYTTESWVTRSYYLPRLRDDFVLLTPVDLLTRDDTWINHSDMLNSYDRLPAAIEDDQLRAQVENYFMSLIGDDPSSRDLAQAAARVIQQFPHLIDLYIKFKEDTGASARDLSATKTADVESVLVDQVKRAIPDISAKTRFYQQPWTSYQECLERVALFKSYVEDQDGYKVINRAGKPFSQESEVQLFFGLIWCQTDFDVNREPNNGRGPVDFKVSFGSGDKSLIEFKLASNTQLRRNLENQIKVYERANRTHSSIKVIVCYTDKDVSRARSILEDLGLENTESVVTIDARSDNKPSASKA